jgi:hypothetical protein
MNGSLSSFRDRLRSLLLECLFVYSALFTCLLWPFHVAWQAREDNYQAAGLINEEAGPTLESQWHALLIFAGKRNAPLALRESHERASRRTAFRDIIAL